MNALEQRLAKCFALALPNLDEQAVRRASTSSVAAWDSLTTVNLVSLVEEEFNIAVPAEDLLEFVSFERVLNVVRRHCDAAGAQ
jgi:acyl carrier protein